MRTWRAAMLLAALGFVAASQLSGRPLLFASYPITPASDILHELDGYEDVTVAVKATW